jgi:hypothetical protein
MHGHMNVKLLKELDWDECELHYNRRENEANPSATQSHLDSSKTLMKGQNYGIKMGGEES